MRLLPLTPVLLRALVLAPAFLLSLIACARSPADPARQALEGLREAAEARDAEAFSARLSDGFRGMNGMTKAEAMAALRRYFAAYESVSLTLHGVETETHAGGVAVRCVTEFSGRGQKVFGLGALLPGDAAYRFTLVLADEGGALQVREASWETAAGGVGEP
jgi:hypothetical protein